MSQNRNETDYHAIIDELNLLDTGVFTVDGQCTGNAPAIVVLLLPDRKELPK